MHQKFDKAYSFIKLSRSIVFIKLYRRVRVVMYYTSRSLFAKVSWSVVHYYVSSLNIGCWNVQYFKTAQLYFKSIIDQFDILAISEHSLFEEQLGILKTATDGTYNYHAVSANDNPRIISGEQTHGNIQLTILLPQLKASNLTVSWELNVNLVAVDLCLF